MVSRLAPGPLIVRLLPMASWPWVRRIVPGPLAVMPGEVDGVAGGRGGDRISEGDAADGDAVVFVGERVDCDREEPAVFEGFEAERARARRARGGVRLCDRGPVLASGHDGRRWRCRREVDRPANAAASLYPQCGADTIIWGAASCGLHEGRSRLLATTSPQSARNSCWHLVQRTFLPRKEPGAISRMGTAGAWDAEFWFVVVVGFEPIGWQVGEFDVGSGKSISSSCRDSDVGDASRRARHRIARPANRLAQSLQQHEPKFRIPCPTAPTPTSPPAPSSARKSAAPNANTSSASTGAM